MRYQFPNAPTCGPAALGNAMRALGLRAPSESTLRAMAGTDATGTDSPGLMRAARELGLVAMDFFESTARDGVLRVHTALREGKCCILHLPPPMDHWVLAFGLLGSRVMVFDSSNTARNARENGVQVFGKRELARALNRGHGDYYGITIGRKE